MKTLLISVLLIVLTVSCSTSDDVTTPITEPAVVDPTPETPTTPTTPVNMNLSDSSVVWTGETITFTKAADADPTAEANQDRLTETVWITRGNNGGQIYNIVSESVSDKDESPAGTEWAVGSLDNINDLTFDKFRATVVKPKNVVGQDLVLHLIEDDIFIGVVFSSWSESKSGEFSYARTTPAP